MPGTIVESHGVWMQRLTILARSLQACAGAAVLVVALVAAAVIAVATRAGLAARRDAIEIVHGLGATDGYIAARFADADDAARDRGRRARRGGGAAGADRAHRDRRAVRRPPRRTVPVLAANLPRTLWLALPCLPLAAALIGWTTAQATVRTWLRRLA